eukprot:CAMPEP_0185822942 /NCGR_PEP_ID=MMETSP1322-20130828/27429_1 /TAXON_ID=265543 /ORGANISM="Minutocellus polymorphus, Strain RCC2270" /LENGTH=34 /DNA_ID= /DNA_START= /DNA_END= /DNA_ORIENTATION=
MTVPFLCPAAAADATKRCGLAVSSKWTGGWPGLV